VEFAGFRAIAAELYERIELASRARIELLEHRQGRAVLAPAPERGRGTRPELGERHGVPRIAWFDASSFEGAARRRTPLIAGAS
jgi:hypothetical protein